MVYKINPSWKSFLQDWGQYEQKFESIANNRPICCEIPGVLLELRLRLPRVMLIYNVLTIPHVFNADLSVIQYWVMLILGDFKDTIYYSFL